jgi:hypothetical protein
VLNKTYSSGCPQFSFDCFGTDYGTFPLDCFENTNIVPKCYSQCLNNCSNHGACENGKCFCFDDFEGDDCSLRDGKTCVEYCVNGYCKKEACICDSGYDGNDCSHAIFSKGGELFPSFHAIYSL